MNISGDNCFGRYTYNDLGCKCCKYSEGCKEIKESNGGSRMCKSCKYNRLDRGNETCWNCKVHEFGEMFPSNYESID
jgi:hypothetical protein